MGRMSREGIPVFVDIGQASSGRRSEGSAGVCGGGGLGGDSIECLSVTAQATCFVLPGTRNSDGQNKLYPHKSHAQIRQ